MSHQSMNLDGARGQRELEPHNFSNGYFHPQHRRYSGLAQIDSMPAHHALVARIYADLYIELEPGMAARFQGIQTFLNFGFENPT